jgi:hypothetical protein
MSRQGLGALIEKILATAQGFEPGDPTGIYDRALAVAGELEFYPHDLPITEHNRMRVQVQGLYRTLKRVWNSLQFEPKFSGLEKELTPWVDLLGEYDANFEEIWREKGGEGFPLTIKAAPNLGLIAGLAVAVLLARRFRG